MADTNRVEVEFDDRKYAALQAEADRLGLDISGIVERACSAWLTEMADDGSLSLPNATEDAAGA